MTQQDKAAVQYYKGVLEGLKDPKNIKSLKEDGYTNKMIAELKKDYTESLNELLK